MNRSKAAFLFSAQNLASHGLLYLWTFTFKEVLAVKDTRKRWNHLLTLLLRRCPNLQGLRVFELHEEHGLHVHVVTNLFIDVNEARKVAEQAGWGRIHVAAMPSARACYLAKYLAKERPDCLHRWRLWAGFGKGWDWTKAKDVGRDTMFSTIYQACKEWQKWKGRKHFFERMDLVRRLVVLTVEHGWEPGKGPNEEAYGPAVDRFVSGLST